MSGDDQHYLPACLIGGFGRRVTRKSWRKSNIVVRDLKTGLVTPSTAEKQASSNALYRLTSPPPGVDQDFVDSLWGEVETNIPALVARLTSRSLIVGDDVLLIKYAAMAGVRHTTFSAIAEDWQQRRHAPVPVGDDLQWLRVDALINGLKAMPTWRWRVLHSPDDAQRFMLSDRGWIYVQEPEWPTLAIFLPMGPKVGILGYLDSAELPPRQAPFEEHRDLVPSFVEWLNAAAGSDQVFASAVYAHPNDESKLCDLPDLSTLGVNSRGPYRGHRGHGAVTLFD